MISNYKYLLVFVICFSCSIGELYAIDFRKVKTWISDPPEIQLAKESIDDQLGYGRVFIPSYSMPNWEPLCTIYDYKNNIYSDLTIGKSIFLEPGNYRVIFGSANESEDLITKYFKIKEQQTTIIEPDWSALLVTIIDENREKIGKGYEIFNIDSDISIGTKYSKEKDSFNDNRSTWILNPGKYKLVKLGEPHNTIMNFTTFELKEGELLDLTVVIDSKTNNFIGAGEVKKLQKTTMTIDNWNNFIFVKGTFSLNSDNEDSNENSETDISFRGKIDNNIKYDLKPWYLSLQQNTETEWTKNEEDDDLRTTLDKFSLENTGIYFLTDIFGLYSEIDLKSKLFDKKIYFPELRNIAKEDIDKNINYQQKQNSIKISGSLFPLELSEKIGFNFSFLKTNKSNFYIRTGIGLFQSINNSVYENTALQVSDENDISYDLYREVDNDYITGLVLSTGGDFQLANNINYALNGDFIYSLNKDNDYEFTLENNINFKLMKYVSIDYDLNFNYKSEKEYLIYNHQLSVEFSYYFNY